MSLSRRLGTRLLDAGVLAALVASQLGGLWSLLALLEVLVRPPHVVVLDAERRPHLLETTDWPGPNQAFVEAYFDRFARAVAVRTPETFRGRRAQALSAMTPELRARELGPARAAQAELRARALSGAGVRTVTATASTQCRPEAGGLRWRCQTSGRATYGLAPSAEGPAAPSPRETFVVRGTVVEVPLTRPAPAGVLVGRYAYVASAPQEEDGP